MTDCEVSRGRFEPIKGSSSSLMAVTLSLVMETPETSNKLINSRVSRKNAAIYGVKNVFPKMFESLVTSCEG